MVEDVDKALIRAGGFGKSQCFSFFSIVSGMLSGAFFLYSLTYFERLPPL
jgi:hypothetical protein